MPGIARQGDICTGHSCFPPRRCDAFSDDVFVNGRPLHRRSDGWVRHGCGYAGGHRSYLEAGSGTVSCNGEQAGRIGDPIKCGSFVATGSGNVFAGG